MDTSATPEVHPRSVSLAELERATAEHLSPALALRVRTAFSELRGFPHLDERVSPIQIGQLLTDAARPPSLQSPADFLPLYRVTLREHGEATDLPPAEAARHPLLAAWVTPDFGCLIADLLSAASGGQGPALDRLEGLSMSVGGSELLVKGSLTVAFGNDARTVSTFDYGDARLASHQVFEATHLGGAAMIGLGEALFGRSVKLRRPSRPRIEPRSATARSLNATLH